jgi:hypothetical protein
MYAYIYAYIYVYVYIGILAIQLGLLDDAARLFKESGRFDYLNRLYQVIPDTGLCIFLFVCIYVCVHLNHTHIYIYMYIYIYI